MQGEQMQTIALSQYALLEGQYEQVVAERDLVIVERDRLSASEKALQQTILELQARLAWLNRQVFGQKRERFVKETAPGQLSLDFGDAEVVEVPEEASRQIVAAHERTRVPKESAHQGRLPLPADLPRVEEVIEPQGDLSGLVRIGEDVTEILEYTPGSLWVRRIIRPRYARPEALQQQMQETAQAAGEEAPTQIVQASLPDMAFPRFKAGISVLAHILVSKYVDHLPLYRISSQFMRQKVKIADSTFGNWVSAACEHLLPLYKVYGARLLDSKYVQMDETTIRVLEDGKGKCHLGYLWAIFDPVRRLPYYFYQNGRGQEAPKSLLEGFSGLLQSDGYAVYESLRKHLPPLQLVNCMAHIRREFFEARANDEKRANVALTFIRALYAVEEKARNQQMRAEQRLELRQQEALQGFVRFKAWCMEEYQKVLPQSAIGKALAYALRRLDNMVHYLANGACEIDNNLVENIIRPVALGRKNYLFAGSHEAAQRTAMLYTFFALCKHHGVNPEEWLTDVLNRIYRTKLSDLPALLPPFWKPEGTAPKTYTPA